MSLRNRVAIAVGVVVLCALSVVAAVVYLAVGANLRGQNDESLVQVAQNAPVIAAKLKQTGTIGQLVPFGSTQLQILPDAAVGPTNGFVAITDQDVQVASGKDNPYFRDEAYGKVVYRIYTAQFPGNPGTLIRVAEPASDTASTQTALGWLLAALVPAGAIGAAAMARLAAGRVLRPVARLTDTVERIRATGDLSALIETPGQDEVSRLGQAFAAMTAALGESVSAQRRLVADASHELRTPLTSLITNLELLAEQPDDPSVPALAAAALAEAGELRRLINDLAELARDGRASFHIEDVRLDLVAERVAARAASRAPGLRHEFDCLPTLVRGDPDALERAIGNLVDNALKWSPRMAGS
jgi:signal transduction histidine kinase